MEPDAVSKPSEAALAAARDYLYHDVTRDVHKLAWRMDAFAAQAVARVLARLNDQAVIERLADMARDEGWGWHPDAVRLVMATVCDVLLGRP